MGYDLGWGPWYPIVGGKQRDRQYCVLPFCSSGTCAAPNCCGGASCQSHVWGYDHERIMDITPVTPPGFTPNPIEIPPYLPPGLTLPPTSGICTPCLGTTNCKDECKVCPHCVPEQPPVNPPWTGNLEDVNLISYTSTPPIMKSLAIGRSRYALPPQPFDVRGGYKTTDFPLTGGNPNPRPDAVKTPLPPLDAREDPSLAYSPLAIVRDHYDRLYVPKFGVQDTIDIFLAIEQAADSTPQSMFLLYANGVTSSVSTSTTVVKYPGPFDTVWGYCTPILNLQTLIAKDTTWVNTTPTDQYNKAVSICNQFIQGATTLRLGILAVSGVGTATLQAQLLALVDDAIAKATTFRDLIRSQDKTMFDYETLPLGTGLPFSNIQTIRGQTTPATRIVPAGTQTTTPWAVPDWSFLKSKFTIKFPTASTYTVQNNIATWQFLNGLIIQAPYTVTFTNNAWYKDIRPIYYSGRSSLEIGTSTVTEVGWRWFTNNIARVVPIRVTAVRAMKPYIFPNLLHVPVEFRPLDAPSGVDLEFDDNDLLFEIYTPQSQITNFVQNGVGIIDDTAGKPRVIDSNNPSFFHVFD